MVEGILAHDVEHACRHGKGLTAVGGVAKRNDDASGGPCHRIQSRAALRLSVLPSHDAYMLVFRRRFHRMKQTLLEHQPPSNSGSKQANLARRFLSEQQQHKEANEYNFCAECVIWSIDSQTKRSQAA